MSIEGRTSAFVHERVQEIGQLVERAAPEGRALDLLEPDVRKKLAPVLQRAPEAVVRLALLADCLVVAQQCMRADGHLTETELAWVGPLVRDAAPYFAKVRAVYDTLDLEKDGARSFLEAHADDPMVFGGACRATAWMGLELCHRASTRASDPEPLARYEALVSRMLDELYAIGGLTPAAVKTRARLSELLLKSSSIASTVAHEVGPDPRVLAFCAEDGPEVFHAVASASQVHEPDPFDVERIHADARDVFARTLERVLEPGRTGPGRMLLLLGESGSGKTHLMRAFRNDVHGRRLGAVGYLQMTVGSEDYARYLLGRLIDSLQQPHARPEVEQSTLFCLSDAVAELLEPFDRESLREDDLGEAMLGVFVQQQVDALLRLPGFDAIHPDVLRALLYLQRRDAPVTSRVIKFLRCEALNGYEQRLLGELTPWTRAADPSRMVAQLAAVLGATGLGALVLLVDQLEDLQNLDAVSARFRRALDVLRHLVEQCPNLLVVVACLEEFYATQRGSLPGPVRDRIERDPDIHRLATHRTADEVEALVEKRLEVLFESQGVRHRDDEPLFPFTREQLAGLAQLRTRDALDRCRRYQERCMRAGALVDWASEGEPVAPTDAAPTTSLASTWNDFLAGFQAEVPDSDEALAALLAESLRDVATEGGPALMPSVEGRFVKVSGGGRPLVIGLCNASARGGGLGKQVDDVRAEAERVAGIPVLARSSEYPNRPKTKITSQLGELVRAGGRRVVVEEADWRVMLAVRAFAKQHTGEAVRALRRAERPLLSLAGLQAIAGPELTAKPSKPVTERPPPMSKPASAAPPSPIASPKKAPEDALRVGLTRGLSPKPVALSPGDLVTHAAFLGSTGSGKTTLALRVIEELALRGLPAILIDRKGDLAVYAADEAWSRPVGDPERAARRAALRERLHVDVFTPGSPSGRPLALPLVPAGIGQLAAHERAQLAGWAASALGAMMGLKPSSLADNGQRVILQKTIEVLSMARPEKAPTLAELIEVLDRQDPDVVAAVGRLDPKHFTKLVEHLETLRLGRGHLLGEANDEELDPATMLGSGPGGRTRLTVISTKFLGDATAIEFWMARFLVTLGRWSSQHPSSSLRGVVLLDEADLYMPATRKPATKEPLQDLLRRARSAGLGVLLATQSPGDLDYKGRDNIRTWWIGRIAADTAIEKMKPLLSEARVQIGPKLAGLAVGEFFQVASGHVTELKADRSLLDTEQLAEDRIEELARASRMIPVGA